jgi:hypothetical protein
VRQFGYPAGSLAPDRDRERDPAPFPRCELFGLNVVRQLPPECPMRDAKPFDTLDAMQNDTLWHPADGDPHPAVASADVYKTCSRCIARNLSHPHIRFLRAQND